jgi:hypothetical protein
VKPCAVVTLQNVMSLFEVCLKAAKMARYLHRSFFCISLGFSDEDSFTSFTTEEV